MGRPRQLLHLARFRGVPILVAPSWLVIGVLSTIIYEPVLRDAVGDISASTAYLGSVAFAVTFGLCVLAHEIGHTVVSTALGHRVRRVILFGLGGVSEIEDEPDRPRDEILIALAGPLVSLLVAALAWLGYLATTPGSLVAVLLAMLAWSNAVIAAFNLLPGLPLDGGQLVRAAIWGLGASAATGTRVAGWAGRGCAVLVIVSGVVLDRVALGLIGSVLGVVVGGYLWIGATQALKTAQLLERLPVVRIPDLLRPGLLVPADLSVAEALRRVWEGDARGLVLVDAADHPSAIVDELLITAVPPDRRPWTSVTDVARPLEPGLLVPAGIDAKGLLDRMQKIPAHEYLVVDADGAPAGIIAAIDFARALRGTA